MRGKAKRHPAGMGADEVVAFLTHLADERQVVRRSGIRSGYAAMPLTVR